MYQHNNLYVATPAAILMYHSVCIWLLVLCKSKAVWPAGYYHVYGNNRGVAPAVLPTFIPLLGEAMHIVLPLISVNLVIRCYTDCDGQLDIAITAYAGAKTQFWNVSARSQNGINKIQVPRCGCSGGGGNSSLYSPSPTLDVKN